MSKNTASSSTTNWLMLIVVAIGVLSASSISVVAAKVTTSSDHSSLSSAAAPATAPTEQWQCGFITKATCVGGGCQWCLMNNIHQPNCVPLTNGTCCSPGLGECGQNNGGPRTFCNAKTQVCDIITLNPNEDGHCNIASCCPLDKPSLCGQEGNNALPITNCYNKEKEQCCAASGTTCGMKQTCCGGPADSNYLSPPVCCNEDQVCDMTKSGNVCLNKTQPGVCKSEYSQSLCENAQDKSTGEFPCQFCHGFCMEKSRGACCSVPSKWSCSGPNNTFSDICRADTVCRKQDLNGTCMMGSCCAKDKPALCSSVITYKPECYNPEKNYCCLVGGTLSGMVTPIAKANGCVATNPNDGGNPYCPQGGSPCNAGMDWACCPSGTYCTSIDGIISTCSAV